jgi:protein tyrosine phosphatase
MPGFPKNFRHVAEQVYAGGIPDAHFLSFFKNTLGGKTVLSLDAKAGADIDFDVKKLSMSHIIIPLSSAKMDLNDDTKYIINAARNGLFDNQPIYIHCVHGRDRTGFVVALYRVIKQNWTYKQAIDESVKYGYGHGTSPEMRKLWKYILSLENLEQKIIENDDMGSLDDDIVQTMRDDFLMGNVPPAFTMTQSFAPETDVRRQISTYEPHNKLDLTECDDDKMISIKRKLRKKIMEDIMNNNDIPMVGCINGFGAPNSAGPSAMAGSFSII